MRRRQFLGGLGVAAAAWPLAVQAQQQALPIIGFLSPRSAGDSQHLTAAFRHGLKEAGFVEGHNVAIEYRWAEGQLDRVPAMLTELIRRQVTMILAAGSGEALAAKAATKTIPIVFAGGSDPVAIGLVSSLNQPGGNVTGATIMSHLIGAKRLEVLRELVPSARLIAILVEPNNPSTAALVKDTQAGALTFDLRTVVHVANSESSLEAAFAAMVNEKASALLIGGGPLLADLRRPIAALAARHGLPTMYSLREYVETGGLISYGSSLPDTYRQAGEYAGRVLKGEKPADLPILQATKFELVINLKTAKALRLAIPDKLIALADEVIE
jgi:putative tryptophan/tyrosine transport system substrate-binding protein